MRGWITGMDGGGLGIEEIKGDSGMYAGAGMEYYMGASSDPKRVITSRMNDEWVWYYQYPYYKECQMERDVFFSLCKNGSLTKVKSLERFIFHHGEAAPKWMAETMSGLVELLAGRPGRCVEHRLEQMVEVKVRVTGDFEDGWSEFERRFGSVSGSMEGSRVLELNRTRGDAEGLKVALGGSGFEVESISDMEV